MNLLFNSDIMNLLLKNRRPNVVLLEFFNCRWGCGEAGKMGKVKCWCGWEGGRVVGGKVGQGSQQSGKTWKIILFSKSQGNLREKNKIMTKSGNF